MAPSARAAALAAGAALAAMASPSAAEQRGPPSKCPPGLDQFGPVEVEKKCYAPPGENGWTLSEVARRECTTVVGNITSAGEGAPDTGFISAPHLRNVVAPFRDDCGSLANLEVTTTHVTGIDLSGLRTVEGALEIVGRHDGSSQLEHLDLRNLVAVFGYNCPTGFDGAASSSGGMGADGMDTPVTALPDAFKPDAASTDDFFAAWVEATANITDFIDYRGSAEVDPATFQPAPYQRSAPGGMEISKHPNLGPALDLGRLLFVNGDLVLRKLDAVVALELSGLRAVNGDVVVAENRALASLASLSNLLVVVDDIIVSDNAQLAALDLRELLILLGRLVVDHNPHLVYASAESMIAAHPPQVVCGLCWLAGAQICYDDTEYGACKRDGFAPEHKDLCDWSVEIGCGACFEHSSCSYRDEDMDMPTIQVEHNDALTTFAIQDLFSVGGSVSVAHNPSLLGLYFEELDRVFGQVVIAYNNALRFVAAPLLENIFGGVLVSQNNNLVAAVFPNLNTVFDLAYYYTTPAFVAVTENPRLELVDMSALHNVTGHVDIVSNPSLPLVQFQCLEQVDSLTCDPTQCECNNFNDAVSPQCLPPTKPCGTGLHSDDVVCAYGKISQGEDPIYSLAEVAAAGCKIAFQVDSTPEDDVGHISLPHLQATVEDFNVVGSYNLKSFEARSLVFVGDDLRLWNCDSSEFGGAEAEASDDEGTDLSSGRGRGCRYDMVLSSFDLSSLIAVDDVFYIEDLRQLSGTIDLGSLVSVGGEQLSIDQLNQRSGDDTAFIQQIDLCALKVVLGVFELEYLPMLKRVCLDSLVSVGRFEVDDNLSLVYLNLPELRVVSGGPYEDAFGSEQARDLEIDDNLSLQFFGAPKLVLVAAEVEVQECPVLTTIQLPSLVLAGKIDIEQNDHLEIINLVSLKFVYPIGFLGTYDRKAQIDIVHNYALYDLDLHNLKSVADSLIINDSSIGCLFLPSLLSVATLPSPSCGRDDYYGLQLHNHSALYTFGAPELLTAGPTKYDCGRSGGRCCRCEAGIEVETEGQYTGSVLAEVNLQNVTTLATTSSEIEFNSNPVLPEVDMPCLERDGATVFCVDPTECFCKADFCERKSFVSCGTAVGPQGCPAVPTKAPTKAPTLPPKTRPTKSPTKSPTDDTRPTPKPTPMPTKRPTKSPTSGPPTKSPTKRPTMYPTYSPTATYSPTKSPTKSPTMPRPTPRPTPSPTYSPTGYPTSRPTPRPTPAPTRPPFEQCCEQLDWPVSPVTDTCGASKLKKDDKCFKKATFFKAERICADEGARLCGFDELPFAAKGTGCGLDTKLVWTGEQCAGGKKQLARTGDGSSSVCAGPKRKFGVRCCANVCPTERPTASPKPTPSPPRGGVCLASGYADKCVKLTQGAAAARCAAAGAFLPSTAGDDTAATKGAGCGLPKLWQWTSTPCGKGKYYVVKGNKRRCAPKGKLYASACITDQC